MCASIESSSLVAAGFGTTLSQVAGFHRAVPSTTLDKASMQFVYILLIFSQKSMVFSIITRKVHKSYIDFSRKTCYHILILLRR